MNVKHEINRQKTTVTWLTPPDIFTKLGDFDLDPCASIIRPWDIAKVNYTEQDDGLSKNWVGRVWLNPPYGPPLMPKFLQKMAQHNNGIALVFNRTETDQFHKYVWPVASGILFKKGRIHFLDENGNKPGNGSGCGSVLIAYGKENADILKNSGIEGKFIYLNQ